MLIAAVLATSLHFGPPPIKVVDSSQVPGAAEPQAAVDNSGNVFVSYGSGEKIYISRSSDRGATFDTPVAIDAPKLMLGKRRGPRICISNENVVLAAVSDGDLKAWSWSSGSQLYPTAPVTINDASQSAAEGLFGMGAKKDEIVVAWLDHREKGTEIYESSSQDGGQNWSPSVLVYKSPSGTVCECCQPSVAIGPDGAIHIMFRNVLNGNRDMYVSDSTDDGATWSPARQLGEGHWKLDVCPMDGGALDVDDQGILHTIWRRDDTVYRDRPDYKETKIGIGVQPWVCFHKILFGVYLKRRPGPLMFFRNDDQPLGIAPDADDPMIAAPEKADGPVVIVYGTSKGEIMEQRVN